MTVTVTSSRFRGLANPYTGDPMVVKMTVPRSGPPMFFSPDTYTPCSALPTRRESCEAAQRRGGVRTPAAPTCPYTGERLEQRFLDGLGWFYAGGFDPRVPRPADEFLYYATMRGGRPSRPAPAAGARVGYVEPRHEEAPRDDGPERTEEAHRIAKDVVERYKDDVGMTSERTAVSMSRPKRHGRRK